MSSCIETQKASALKCCNKQMAFCFTSKNALLEMHLFSASLATCTIIFVKVQCSVNKLEENHLFTGWMTTRKYVAHLSFREMLLCQSLSINNMIYNYFGSGLACSGLNCVQMHDK